METKSEKIPAVSIIMTSYNYARFIGEAIESVIVQTFADWELLVVDDGSQDDSLEVIQRYIDKFPNKIKLFTHPNNENKNIKETLELGFSKVRGNYVAFLESDDVWNSKYLESKIPVFKKYSEVSLVFSDLELIGEKLAQTYKYKDYLTYSRYIGRTNQRTPFDPMKTLFLRNPVVSFSNIVIRSEYLNFITLNKEHEIWSDWWLIMQAALVGKFYYVNEKLLYWRVHEKSANNEFMSATVQYLSGSMFKIDMLALVKDFCCRNNDMSLMRRVLGYTLSVRAHIRRLLHDLGFAMYSPMSVIRSIFRFFQSHSQCKKKSF